MEDWTWKNKKYWIKYKKHSLNAILNWKWRKIPKDGSEEMVENLRHSRLGSEQEERGRVGAGPSCQGRALTEWQGRFESPAPYR